MEEYKASLEIIAPTVEEAIRQGMDELGVPRDALNIEVLDEGSRGVLGLGARQARVRLTVASEEAEAVDAPAPAPPSPEAVPTAMDRPDSASADDEETLRITRETITDLIQRMGIEAHLEARFGEADAPGKIRPLLVDITGDDLSILIGRRGETLNALQYITRLIVGKELKKPVAVVIDIEGYRARRETQLRRLARRVAEQTVESARRMALEPMPANERRVIHIELRDHPGVTTESVGEGRERKVTIIPRT